MARETKEKDKSQEKSITSDKRFRKGLTNLNNLIGQSTLSLYGTDRNNDVDSLNSKFQEIINTQINTLKKNDENDMTSFMASLVSQDKKMSATDNVFNGNMFNISGDDYSTVQSFIYEAYRNRLLEQSDLHEVASQLIELSEAILITRDAIISPDVVEGRMNRELKFDNIDEDDSKNNISMVEKMEDKFELLDKIKNFIVPKTLEYGEYYAYIIPYARLFQDFSNEKEKDQHGQYYKESTVMEGFDELNVRPHNGKMVAGDTFDTFIEHAYENYIRQDKTRKKMDGEKGSTIQEKVSKDEFRKDMENMLNNISVSNNPIPLPAMEEGIESFEYLKEMTEKTMTEENKDMGNWFDTVANSKIGNDGIILTKETKKKEKFDDISGCYFKLIEPTKILPLEIMDQVIGYYFVQAEDITPLSGAISETLYYSKFENNRKEATVIDAIAERVVKSFNRPFLEKNSKFKRLIVECINYYNLNEKRLKFQFIPVEYIQEFKIDKDEVGHGQSMIKKSLFYAKLYLMLLLFKIMSIILYSNDQRVNYLRSSGIDKNIANKVQEIARLKQARQINMTDLFSYTTLINKVGNGSEMYIPMGRSNERPMETEIMQGQDVQLNSDLLEMLKNAYILGTGVPAAIINYLNEADFAKQIEQNNSKFFGRVVNYQLDFNKYITEMYQKLMRWSTNIQENVIDNFTFTFTPPKTTNTNTKSEAIGQFQTFADFAAQLIYKDAEQEMDNVNLKDEIRIFKALLADEHLTGFDLQEIKDMKQKASMLALQERLKPNPSNGDSGDDLGIDGVLDDVNGDDGMGGL